MGLKNEEKRWEEDMKLREKMIVELEFECLLNASFLSYYGPFDQEFR